jgi:hypothetical protein
MPTLRLEVEERVEDQFEWTRRRTFTGPGSYSRAKGAVADLPAGSWWRIFSPTVGGALAQRIAR